VDEALSGTGKWIKRKNGTALTRKEKDVVVK
jgi:hypothetical protein